VYINARPCLGAEYLPTFTLSNTSPCRCNWITAIQPTYEDTTEAKPHGMCKCYHGSHVRRNIPDHHSDILKFTGRRTHFSFLARPRGKWTLLLVMLYIHCKPTRPADAASASALPLVTCHVFKELRVNKDK
jgi:hypothetical protein